MSKSTPMHFGGFGRRPEPSDLSAQVARNLGLSSHAAVTSPCGDVRAAVARALSDMDALAESEAAAFSMLAPGDLIRQSIDALSALGSGPDYEPAELSAALTPALCVLGRAHAGADDDEAATHDDESESTPAARRAKYTTREKKADISPEQMEMRARCLAGFEGHVVSHIRAR